ncbi:hypothetical protein PHYBOEH_007946 [Phytophthora boehmeriae]|uniref:Uncharacterized protein n=1 Tax=Phytophthora boehmeriae TaxID=109152 RepID=A0A8T1X6X6_9STRA|nr:hypothetical protein PHYBOEH_007946 [Phytophthora boehmeriae]
MSSVSSAPSPSSGFGIRQYFRRPSQSPPTSQGAIKTPSDLKETATSPESDPLHLNEQQRRHKQRQMQRSSVFGSCAQSVGTVASVLFNFINQTGHYDEKARDNTVTRQAKMLYVQLLESVQKERGEWQGFSSSSDGNNNNGPEASEVVNPRDGLSSRISASGANPADQLGVLNELLEVSFRNLMGPLVPLELYTQHRKKLLRESLAMPPALTTLLAIRGILNQLEREVRHCLLRLLALWDLIALVSGEAQPLRKTIADKHHHVFSESSEFENMTARKSERQDTIAIELLEIMVLYRDILFSDIEYILTKQELQTNPKLVEKARIKAWPADSDPATLSEQEDDYYSDVSSVSSSDENQVFHDDGNATMSWGQEAPLQPSPLALRSHASSFTHDDQEQHVADYYDEESEEDEWSIPPPTHNDHHRDHRERKSQRSRGVMSPPLSGGAAAPLVPVPMIPSSSEGIPPPERTHSMAPEHQPMERVNSGRQHKYRSSSATLSSPTLSAASLSSKSSARKLMQRTKQRSVSSMSGTSERGRSDNHWQDTTSNESRSPPPLSRSTIRRNGSKRLHSSKNGPSRRRLRQSSDHPRHDELRRAQHAKTQAKPAASPGFLAVAASYFTVSAVTVCIIATITTAAVWGIRKAQRN